MRTIVLLSCMFGLTLPAIAQSEPRLTGRNCDLISPPLNAGEVMNHGVIYRVFPRAKDIGKRYSGCQVMFQPDGDKWLVVSVTEVEKGDPTWVWSPSLDNAPASACRYRKGKAVFGDANDCPMPEFLIQKSLASGCSQLMQEAISKKGLGAPTPRGCEFR